MPAEPGCLHYEAYRVAEQPTTFYVIETWSSRADADRHVMLTQTDGSVGGPPICWR